MKETLRAKFLTFLEKDVRIRDAAQREQYVDFAETKLPEFICMVNGDISFLIGTVFIYL